MKVLAINGSPHKGGNTAKAMHVMAEVLREQGVEVEEVHIGSKVIRGCMGCNACYRNRDMKCIHGDDPVNELLPLAAQADGLILGAAVHYAGINGTMKSFLDRLVYLAEANGGLLKGKVGAAITACRRTGGSATMAGLQYYFPIAGMYSAGSTYWSVVHGHGKATVEGDEEGLITVKNQTLYMAHLLKMKEQAGLPEPELFKVRFTNFMR